MSGDLLLLSNSRMPNLAFLEHAREAVAAFLDGRREVYFAPYAMMDHDGYTARVQEALAPLGVGVIGLHRERDPRAAVERAALLFAGGGNSFRLLHAFQRLDLLEPVRRRVQSGTLRYMGASAGANLACPTIRTTNDMPILEPASLTALQLIPFQINPHYVDPDQPSKHAGTAHMGETRQQRLLEFLEQNDVAVVGLREGAWLRQIGNELRLGGSSGARIFRRGVEPEDAQDGADLSWLLSRPSHFDQPSLPL